MDIPAINNKARKRCISGGDASMLPAPKRHGAEGDAVDALSRTTSFSYSKLRHEDYTIGWVAALPIELAAASAMLDNKHPPLPTLEGDRNYYRYGNIGAHNIVIACLPSGHYGTNNAAVVANNMARSFPCISIRLMVGIGGGVPKSDVRLGDVVVGHDVLQYDFGKTVHGGEFTCTSHPVRPPHQILTALSNLRAEHEQSPTQTPSILADMLYRNQDMINYSYPSQCQDRLFDTAYRHSDETEDCDQCDQSKLICRPSRPGNEVRIHYGTIASGNQVVKDAALRDSWASRNNILCFEMEAAGLIDHFPCLVIRGICDYCDSHKNKTWQQYAAATAAAYAKELLQSIHPASELISRAIALDNHDSTTPELQQDSPSDSIKISRKEKMESLRFEHIDNRRMNIKRAHLKTCKWMLEKEEYLDWLDERKIREHGGFLWIKGKPGAGKSTMMKFISDASQKKRAHPTTLDFFFNARGHDLEKSTTGLYQSILFQLLTKIPSLQDILDCSRLFANGTPRQWTNDLMKELIERAIEKLTSTVVCYIDALDECHDDQIRDMISFFERLGQLAISTGVGFYVCFSSRHYPHISMREGLGLEITLEKQQHHGDDIRQYIDSKLAIGHGKVAHEIKSELQEKASGVFMWAVLVVEILNKERDNGRKHKLRQKLREIPKDLHELFRSILTQDHNNREELLLCFQWILFSKRPLTLLELHVAILSQTDDPTQLDPEDLTEADSKIFLVACSKGLAEVANSKSPTVQLIHESVKDFLLKENGLRSLFNDLNDNLSGQSHIQLRDCCNLYINKDMGLRYDSYRVGEELNLENLNKAFPFLEYAMNSLLFHADAAGSCGIHQSNFLHNFHRHTWIQLHNGFEKFRSRRYDLGTDLLYILAEANAPSLVEECTSPEYCLQVGVGRYGCPLLAAMVHGHRRVVEVFRHNIVNTLPVDNLAGNEEHDCEGNTNVSKLSRDFTFTSSGRSLISFLAEYGDLDLFLTLYHRRDRLQLPSGAPKSDSFHGESAFHCAVRNSHWQIAKILVTGDQMEDQIDFRIRDTQGRVLVRNVISEGGPEVVDRLLATGQVGSRLLFSLAASHGKLQFVQAALEANGVNPDLKDVYGETPLSNAANEGRYEIVQALLASGRVCTESKNELGRTPLSHAARTGQVEVVKILLATAQICPDSKDNSGMTPLSCAASFGHLEIVKILLATGQVSPDSKDNSGRTPLSCAASFGHLEIVQLLLATGQVSPDSKDNSGRTPLSCAALFGHLEIVQLLLATGQVCPDSKDKFGQTPLSHAASFGHLEVDKILLATGQVNPNSKNITGFSPLYTAIKNQHAHIVSFLLEIDQVEPNSRHEMGCTPLMVAATGRSMNEIQVLRALLGSARVDRNAQRDDGETALSLARRFGNGEAFEEICRELSR
ncbi:unnamed protein product [Clonostachys rhizophaga]|uniref:Nucleoside phosphorylase domain-containing protein n=1 Tax=Clonostachys rhizophaga TaxID=160324 RepID=A0A9N9YYF7_9HYPO|nr:unnamed protein product [Clonostachys rhizophaga]